MELNFQYKVRYGQHEKLQLKFLFILAAVLLLLLAVLYELPRERPVDVGDEGLGILEYVGIKGEETQTTHHR